MSSLTRSEIDLIDTYCLQLNEAVKELGTDYRFDKDIVNLIKESKNTDSKLPISVPSFSNYMNATEKGYHEKVDFRVYKKYLDILNPIIRKEYKKSWNLTTKKYEIANQETEIQSEKTSGNASDFSGVWKGYSWNKSRLKISILSFKITEKGNIICNTEKQKFTDIDFHFISQDVICFALKTTNRHIYMIGKVGKRDDFKTVERINFAYTDSGAVNIKCGLVVLIKTDVAFDSIETKRYLPSEIEDKSIVKFLKNTQQVADYFE